MAKSTEDKAKKPASESFNEIFNSLKSVGRKIEPHLGFAYAIALLAAIGICILFVGQTLRSTTTSTPTSSIDNDFLMKFDDATIEKVRALNSNSSNSQYVPPTIPEGRINPFAE